MIDAAHLEVARAMGRQGLPLYQPEDVSDLDFVFYEGVWNDSVQTNFYRNELLQELKKVDWKRPGQIVPCDDPKLVSVSLNQCGVCGRPSWEHKDHLFTPNMAF